MNPAAAVRGPTHVVTTGATPVLAPAEARRLLAAIDTGTCAGLRDRALVSVMLYSFARVSAVIGMRRQDYFRQERQGWLRLHEKGGTRHDVQRSIVGWPARPGPGFARLDLMERRYSWLRLFADAPGVRPERTDPGGRGAPSTRGRDPPAPRGQEATTHDLIERPRHTKPDVADSVRADRARGSGTQAHPVEGRGRARDRHVRRRDPAPHRDLSGRINPRRKAGRKPSSSEGVTG